MEPGGTVMSPRSVVKCAALALASFGLAATASIAKAQTTADLVYEALSKDARGKGTAKLVKQYKCLVPPGPNGKSREMRKISLPMSFDFIPHDCDEDLHSGVIRTTWAVLLRIGPAPAGG